jgi:hypothetical protein
MRIDYRHGGSAFHVTVQAAFAEVNFWDTRLRDFPGTIELDDAQAFLSAVERIIGAVNGRLGT